MLDLTRVFSSETAGLLALKAKPRPQTPRVLSFFLKSASHGDEVREIPSILTFQKQKCYNG